MNGHYSFDVDTSRDYILLRMAGFFSPEDMPAFADARGAAHAKLTCALHGHVTLTDLRDMKIQSQEMVEAFGRVLAIPTFYPRRLAFVCSPGLLRTQVRRILGDREDVQFFESLRMAEAWLLSNAFDAPIQKLVVQDRLYSRA